MMKLSGEKLVNLFGVAAIVCVIVMMIFGGIKDYNKYNNGANKVYGQMTDEMKAESDDIVNQCYEIYYESIKD